MNDMYYDYLDAPVGRLLLVADGQGLRHVAFEVDDLEGLYARLTAAGVPFVSPPVIVPFKVVGNIRKRLCYLKDPDGAIVELGSYTQED